MPLPYPSPFIPFRRLGPAALPPKRHAAATITATTSPKLDPKGCSFGLIST